MVSLWQLLFFANSAEQNFILASKSTITVISVIGKTILSAYKVLSCFWPARINSNDMKNK